MADPRSREIEHQSRRQSSEALPQRVGQEPLGTPSTRAIAEAVGNFTLLAALEGDSIGGLGDLLGDAMTLSLAGPQPVAGPGLGSNHATQAVMRLAQGPATEAVARLRPGGGRPLPPAVLARVNAVFGHDFSHVRLHSDAAAAEAAQALNARAFTVAHEIWFNVGQLDPGSPSGEALLLHELTHVLQHDEGRLPTPSGPESTVSQPSDPHEREAESTAQALAPLLHSVEPSPVAELAEQAPAVDPGEGLASPSLASDGAAWLADKAQGGMEWIIRKFSPQLADLLAKGPVAFIEKAMMPAIDKFLSSLLGGADLSAVLGQLQGSLSGAFGVLAGAAQGDAGCCEAFAQAIGAVRDLASAFWNNPAVEFVRGVLGTVNEAIGTLTKMVLAPAFDVAKTVLGGLWECVSGVAGTVWGWISSIKDVASDAFGWVMKKLGLGGEGEGGVLAWLTEQASKVWTKLRETFEPVIAPIQSVARVLVSLSPLGALLSVVKAAPKVVEAVGWLWEHRDDPNIVASAHEEMGGTLLPGLLDAATDFGAFFGEAVSWLGDLASTLFTGLGTLLQAVSGVPVLSIAKGFFEKLTQAAAGLQQWALGAFASAREWLSGLIHRVAERVRPWADVLCSLGMALLNPAMIPVILAGQAWIALPDCVKGPIIDLLLDAAIAVLSAAPSIGMFGLLWPLLRAGVVGFLEGVRQQAVEVKIAVTDKLAKILSGGSPAFLLGFVKGFLRGVWEGLSDPFKLAWAALSGLSDLVDWLTGVGGAPAAEPGAGSVEQVSEDAPGPDTAQMAAELGPPVDTVVSGFMPAISETFSGGEGLTLDGLVAKLGDLWGQVQGAISGAAQRLAVEICGWFMQPSAESTLGDGVGWLAGTVALEVLLALATAGTWEAISPAIKTIARVLDWTGEAMGAAFKLLGKLGGYLLDGAKALGRWASSTGGALGTVLGALREVGEKLMRYADELLGRAGREVAEEGLEKTTKEVAEEGLEKTAKEVAEEGGEKAAKEVAEEGGEKSVKEAAEEGGERGSKEAAQTPDFAEKHAVALEAKLVSDAMEATGAPVTAVIEALNAMFCPRYPWLHRFEAVPASLGIFDIYMVASRKKVDVYRARKRRMEQTTEIGGVEVRGFRNAGEVMERTGNLKNKLRALGFEDAQVGIRGSAVTGQSSKGWGPFEWDGAGGRKISDVDFFFTSPSFERKYGSLFDLDGTLNPKDLKGPASKVYDVLAAFGEQSSDQLGRKVSAWPLRESLVSSLPATERFLR